MDNGLYVEMASYMCNDKGKLYVNAKTFRCILFLMFISQVNQVKIVRQYNLICKFLLLPPYFNNMCNKPQESLLLFSQTGVFVSRCSVAW